METNIDMGAVQLGSVVWAKFGKSSYWPGMVITEDMTLTGLRPKPEHVCIIWLESFSVSQVKTSYVKPFWLLLREQTKKMSRHVGSAVSVALQILSERGKVDLEQFDDIMDWGSSDDGYLHMAQSCPQRFEPHPGNPVPDLILDCLKQKEGPRDGPGRYDYSMRRASGRNMSDAGLEGDDGMEVEGHVKCLACSRWKLTVYPHPLFEGSVCEPCRDQIEISLFATDTDGSGSLCVVCGLGGKLLVCDKCTSTYCDVCIIRHTDRRVLQLIEDEENWACFLCAEYSVATHGRLRKKTNPSTELIKFSEHDYVHLDHGFPDFISTEKRKIRVLSLYDGIGTGRLVLEQLGLEVDRYYACEIDSLAVCVSARLGQVEQLGNVLNLTSDTLERICPIDLLIGGPPCDDLSLANPDRKGFNGSAIHTYKFCEILLEVQRLCRETNHVFFLMENSGNMPTVFREILSSIQSRPPAIWDSKYFSGMTRRRFFWGNIPGLQSMPQHRQHLEEAKTVLSNVTNSRDNRRKAMVTEMRTITCSKNSLSIHSGKGQSVVTMEGKDDHLHVIEIEKLFGFPPGFTDHGRLDIEERRKLLGRAWCVPVIQEILLPLRQYYRTKQE